MSEITGWDPTIVVPDCPKCGSDKGWDGPRYAREDSDVGYGIHERLEYTCQTCGYVRREPTKDAKA